MSDDDVKVVFDELASIPPEVFESMTVDGRKWLVHVAAADPDPGWWRRWAIWNALLKRERAILKGERDA